MIETIKGFVINIAVVIVFISAIEVISPNNKFKKYIGFVLGLIFIAVMINPIIKMCKKDKQGIENSIRIYEDYIKEYDTVVSSSENFKNGEENAMIITEMERNLSNECIKILKNRFPHMSFKCDCVCSYSDSKPLSIKQINLYVKNEDVETVEKVNININRKSNTVNEKYKDIVDCIKNELKIDSEKIKLYKMED